MDDSMNFTLQRDEVEALGSIYGDDFVIEEHDPPTFSISIRPPESESESGGAAGASKEEAVLMVTFASGYPGFAPPIYQLSIPWIRGNSKKEIQAELDQIYLDHIGGNIVYLWVEKIRDILYKDCEIGKSVGSIVANLSTKSSSNADAAASGKQSKKEYSKSQSSLIFTGDPVTDRKSTFQAHVAAISDVSQVPDVLKQLNQERKIASATHNMYAYRIANEGMNSFVQDCEDDGETHAGSRLLHLLQILDCRNVIVVVTRWYGGIQLHGDRFKHINNVARHLLEQQGFIKSAVKGSKK